MSIKSSGFTLGMALLFSALLPLQVVQAENQTPFDPDYPAGGAYDVLRALIIAGPGDNMTRCSADFESGLIIGIDAATLLALAAQSVCDVDPSTLLDCGIALGLWEVLQLAEFEEDACALQDGAIDSAEIEAAFENTVSLITINNEQHEKLVRIEQQQVEGFLSKCTEIVNLRLPNDSGGRQEQVSELVGQRIDEFEITSDYAITEAVKIAQARGNLAAGDAEAGAGNFATAYRKYCAAYKNIAKANDGGDD